MKKKKEEYPISKHIFMFPFIINNSESYKKNFNNNNEWLLDAFTIKEDMDFNEYHYFYPFVQKLLFSKGENNNILIKKYHRSFEIGKFIFEIKKEKQNEKYELIIPHKGIELLIIEYFSIGILSLHLENYIRKDFNDILLINDFARRIYPQFLPLFENDGKDEKGNNKYIGAKIAFLPDLITIKLDDEIFAEENFKYYSEPTYKSKIVYASYINKFLKDFDFKHILDDRMFVVSYVRDSKICKKIQKFLPDYLLKQKLIKQESDITTEYIDKWYQYCFVDGSYSSCQSEIMKKELLNKCTYHRWIKWGTIWGITRYSLVALFTSNPPDFLLEQVNRHYCKMAQIWLIIRAILIKFAGESATLAKDIRTLKQEDNSHLLDDIKSLRERYITFINDIWFAEVTPQEQGIEMYQIGLEQMELEKQKKDLRKDIEELFEYVQAENERENNRIEKEKVEIEREQTKKINKVTLIGGILLPVSIMTGIINIIPELFNPVKFLFFSVSIIIFWIFLFIIFRKEKRANLLDKIIIFIFFLIFLILSLKLLIESFDKIIPILIKIKEIYF